MTDGAGLVQINYIKLLQEYQVMFFCVCVCPVFSFSALVFAFFSEQQVRLFTLLK